MFAKRMVLFALVLGLCVLLPAAWVGWAAPATGWQPSGMLYASDGGMTDRFGSRVALQNDTAVVGAINWDSATASDTGAAYVFTHNGANWTERTRLVASDGRPTARFGYSLALEGNTLAVGALYAWRGNPGDPNFALSTGAVYLFTGSGANWTEQTKLTPNDLVQDNSFGAVLDLDGATLIAGAPSYVARDNEAAYVFTATGGVWGVPQKLTAPVPDIARYFGASVALAGDVALVGAPGTDTEQGLVYVFTRSGGVWSPAGELAAADGFDGDGFGCTVTFDGALAVIHACHGGDSTRPPGYVYVFTRNGNIWTPAAAPPRDSENEFEIDSIALAGDHLVLGTTSFPVAPFNGRFFIYRREGASWVAEPAIAQPDDLSDTGFGDEVVFNAEHLLAGAPHLQPAEVFDQGGVYAFRAPAGVSYTLFAPVVAATGGN